MLPTKGAVVLLYVALVIIYFDTLILLHLMLAVNKLALKCTLQLCNQMKFFIFVRSSCSLNMQIKKHFIHGFEIVSKQMWFSTRFSLGF